MPRTVRKLTQKTLWGADVKALKEEINNLIKEVDELKTAYLLHQHAANAAAPNVGVTLIATQAKLFTP